MNQVASQFSKDEISSDNNSIFQRVVCSQSRMLLILEIMTLLILIGLALAFARPQLEGWGVFENFRASGIHGVFEQVFTKTDVRVFENIPLGIAWILGHGAIWALSLVFGFELVAKYLVARWAIRPLIRGINGWVIATLAAVTLPWTNQWHGHNMAEQLAIVFMLVALGAILRLRERLQIGWFVLGTVSILCSLLTYEALILCVLTLPLVVLYSNREPLHHSIGPAIRSAFSVSIGLVIYGLIFCCTQIFAGKGGYQAELLTGPQPLKTPLKMLGYLYKTTYVSIPWSTIFLVALLVCLVGSVVLTLPDRNEKKKSIIVLATTLFLLPLLALSYAVNFYFLSDTERLTLPLGFGFFLLCLTAVSRFSSVGSEKHSILREMSIVMAILVWASIDAFISYRPYILQRSVLNQTEAIVQKNNAHHVLLRDWTGRLGDYFTFEVPDTLQQAMAVEGWPIDISLCTPDGVQRINPMMQKFHGATGLPRCEAMPLATTPRLVLDLKPQKGNRHALPVVTVLGIVDPPHFSTSVVAGSNNGLEDDKFWWINKPQATISVVNRTKKNLMATWNGTFTPPPCPGKYTVVLSVDKKSVTYSLTSPITGSFTTTVPGNGQKLAKLQIFGVPFSGTPCRPEAVNSRTFYLGITDMTVG